MPDAKRALPLLSLGTKLVMRYERFGKFLKKRTRFDAIFPVATFTMILRFEFVGIMGF